MLFIKITEVREEEVKLAEGGGRRIKQVTKHDLNLMRNASLTRKKEIENSSVYLQYRLLWTIGIFLRGKKFPSGDLTREQHKHYVFNIVDFITE